MNDYEYERQMKRKSQKMEEGSWGLIINNVK